MISVRCIYNIKSKQYILIVYIFPTGYANSADVFPIYIGDDRTDEDAFKVLE